MSFELRLTCVKCMIEMIKLDHMDAWECPKCGNIVSVVGDFH